jgi:hypothetical protein
MPYKDPVNEHVKRVVDSMHRRFIAHTDMLGSTNAINSRNPSVEPQGQKLLGQGRVIGGGEGCASWSAGTSNKHYGSSKNRSEMSGGAILGLQDGTLAGDRSKPIQSQTHYEADAKDNNKFGALGDALNSRLDAKPVGPVASNFRSGYAHKDDSPLETQNVETAKKLGFSGSGKSKKKHLKGDGFFDDLWSGIKTGANVAASIAKPVLSVIPHPAAQAAAMGMNALGMGHNECTCPRLKSGKAPKRCKCGAGLSGGSGFAAGTHMDTGFDITNGISSHKKTVGAGLKKGRGRPRGSKTKTGGAVLGLVKAPVAGPLDDTPAAYGNVKPTPQSTSKKVLDKPTTKADMPSSTLSGLGKAKSNPRAEIVKKVMKDRGCTLMQASSIVKKEGLYKKM